MKFLKNKFFTLIMCLCLCLSVLTGCSLGNTKSTLNGKAKAITIGETTITQQEVIDAYKTFYNQNAPYYGYYENKQEIADIFYESYILDRILLEEAKKIVVLSNEDVQEVLDDTYDYFAGQVDSIEKSILKLKGVDVEEDEGYERLKAKEEEKDVYKYEDYNREESVITLKDFNSVTPADEVDLDKELEDLKANIVKYFYTEEDEVRKENLIAEDQRQVRKEAFDKYLSNLLFNAKVEGKKTTAQKALKEEFNKLYESRYQTALKNQYQEYIESTVIGVAGTEFENKLSVEVIAKRYKELLNASFENNNLPESYVNLLTSSEKDALILYHGNTGDKIEDKYFSVQHLLVQFDEDTLEELKNTPGYDTSKDLIYREYYEQVRSLKVNYDEMKTSYRGEDGRVVKNGDEELKASITEIMNEYSTELAKISTPTETDKTMLFNKIVWKYSSDTASLTNDLKGVLGLTISNEVDNHGDWVKDFSNGARALFDNGNGKIGDWSYVVTDYGVHVVMLTGVYNAGEIVSVKGKTDQQIVNELQSARISSLTSQTVYDYIYDQIKEELLGNDSNAGTYFEDYKDQLLEKYEKSELLKKHNILSFKKLQKAVNA